MKFEVGEKVICVEEGTVSFWTCDGYDEYGQMYLAEQTWLLSATQKRPSYPVRYFRKLTKLEKALQ